MYISHTVHIIDHKHTYTHVYMYTHTVACMLYTHTDIIRRSLDTKWSKQARSGSTVRHLSEEDKIPACLYLQKEIMEAHNRNQEKGQMWDVEGRKRNWKRGETWVEQDFSQSMLLYTFILGNVTFRLRLVRQSTLKAESSPNSLPPHAQGHSEGAAGHCQRPQLCFLVLAFTFQKTVLSFPSRVFHLELSSASLHRCAHTPPPYSIPPGHITVFSSIYIQCIRKGLPLHTRRNRIKNTSFSWYEEQCPRAACVLGWSPRKAPQNEGPPRPLRRRRCLLWRVPFPASPGALRSPETLLGYQVLQKLV